MHLIRTLLVSTIALAFASCAGNKAKAQEQVLECDVLFEYQQIENDSISLMVGNTIRLHTGKSQTGQFYPLLLSVRDPQDLDKPTSTEVIGGEEQLLGLLKSKFPFLKRFGVVVGESTSGSREFSEKGALEPIEKLAKQIPEAEILIFREKAGEIVSVESAQ
jgi:hypothetical protein